MANISKEQKETLALIDAIMAMFENQDNMSSENININYSLNPFDFLFKIIEKYSLYDELMNWLVKFLTVSLPVIELSVKGVLLANLKGLIDCNLDPRIPNYMRKGYPYGDDIINYQNGLLFNLKGIDYGGMLQHSPISMNAINFYFGTKKYYMIDSDHKKVVNKIYYSFKDAIKKCLKYGIPIININNKSEINTVHELARAKDMNAFLWYSMNKPIAPKTTLVSDKNYSISYNILDDDGNDYTITRTPFTTAEGDSFLEKMDGTIKLTSTYKKPPFVPGDVIKQSNTTNVYSLCVSSFTENNLPQKIETPYYGEGNEDYVMNDILVTAQGPRDCTFTFVPYSDDNKSLNWYVNSKNFYDFLKPESKREPRNLSEEYAICNFIYHNGSLRMTILPKPFIHKPKINDGDKKIELERLKYIRNLKPILFNSKGEADSKGKYTVRNESDYDVDDETGEYTLNGEPKDKLIECYPKLTVYEFNYDYIMSQQLFDPTVVASKLMNTMLMLRYGYGGNVNFNLGISKTETAYQMRIAQIVKNIVETTAYEVSDCFYTFDNTKYDAMLNDAELKRSQNYPLNNNGLTSDTIDGNEFYSILNEFDSKATLQENTDTFKRAFNQITANITEEVLPEDKYKLKPEDKYKLKSDIITQILKTLTSTLVETLITPKIILLFEVNKKLMGDEGEITDIEDFLKSITSLIVSIVNELRDLILKELIRFVMEFLEKLLNVLKDELIKEQLEYYSRLIKLLWEACAFKASHRKNLESELDHVEGADIDVVEKPLEDNC